MMKLNSMIDERNERTRKRKAIKRKMDSIIGLSVDAKKNAMKLSASVNKMSGNTIRLLDEGYFDSGFVIKKGTLEKFLNGENQYVRGYEMTDDGWEQTDVLNLSDDFKGSVNIGHLEFATFPFIIGEWDKNDLTLVDIENDRKGLDVSIRLDEESIFVKELKRQPYDIGISSEFYYHINDDDTENLSEMLGYYMPVIDEVYIFAYGLVGECGNVNSSGLELKGVDMSKIEKLTSETVDAKDELVEEKEIEETVTEEVEETEDEVAEENIEELSIDTEEAEENEEDIDDSDESASDEEVEEDEESDSDDEDELDEDEDSDEDLDDEEDIDEVDELTEALSLIHELNKQVTDLNNKLAEKDKKLRRLSKKIAVEKEAKARFLAETKNLSIELYENELEAKQQEEEELASQKDMNEYIKTGGIADI